VENGQKFQINLNSIMKKKNNKKLVNLDCVRKPKEILERWPKDMIIILATDERFSKINLMDIKSILIAYRTT
jgi:hypothetical protein